MPSSIVSVYEIVNNTIMNLVRSSKNREKKIVDNFILIILGLFLKALDGLLSITKLTERKKHREDGQD